MIDGKGISDACYHGFANGLSVAVAVNFPKGVELTGVDEEVLRRNPQLLRTNMDGSTRVYHPAKGAADGNLQEIVFLRWIDWDEADGCQLVLRRQTGGPFAVCARFGEQRVFGFERPQRAAYKYTNLDLCNKRDTFETVYVRAGNHPGPYGYLHVEATIEEGVPIVSVIEVTKEEVPRHLLPISR